MYYKIGDVAALFGLTNETLRNYERSGLISPLREESYFRRYDGDTVRRLVGLRTLRNEGFSIKDLQRIYHDISPGEYQDLVEEKIDALERKVSFETLILERMKALRRKMRCVEACPDLIYEGDSPSFYVLPYDEMLMDTLGTAEKKQLSEWVKNLFLVQHMHCLSEGELESPGEKDKVFLVVEEPIARRLGLDCSSPAFLQPPRRCVCCSCRKSLGRDVLAEMRDPLRDYLKSRGLHGAGEPFYISTFVFHHKGEKMSYMDIYIPVQ